MRPSRILVGGDRRVLSKRGCGAPNALGQRLDELVGCTRDKVVVGGSWLAVEHRHDQHECLGLREDDRRQPRPASQPIAPMGTPGGLDGDPGLPEDPDVPTCRPLGHAQPRAELLGGRARAGLEDLKGAERTRGRTGTIRHTRRLEVH